MNYENWISYRYLIASKGRFLTFLNIISITGIAIGVASLIVVIGVMTGFGNNLREKIIGTTPHVMIEKETGIRDYNQIIEKINNIEGVQAASAYIQGNVFLEEDGHALGLAVRGINLKDEKKITKVNKYLVKGKLETIGKDDIVIGNELARYYGYDIGDVITLISPGSGISGKGWRYNLTIAGIFKTGMADYDRSLAIVSLEKAQEIYDLAKNVATGIGVRIVNPNDANDIKNEIYKLIGYSYLIRTWIDINSNLFDALFLEKLGLFIILTLMVLVASFNIISTLIVTVSSKIHDIGILKSIGVPSRSIRKIFTKQGILIGFIGTLWGLIGGIGLSYILRTYIKVPQEIYSIDRVPVEIQLSDVLIITMSAIIITYLATIYPANKAANLQPVDALRYE